jgi:tetratricopeptide (TPR) repeat protein/peroxiredoxin
MALAAAGLAQAAPQKGDTLPPFALESTKGQRVTQKQLESADLGVIYFFSIDRCPSCRSGMEQLKALAEDHSDDKLDIVAVGKQSLSALKAADLPTNDQVSVLAGDTGTLDRYNARLVLPTTYITGPGGAILDIMQGGGASAEAMLLSIADRQLARKKTASARKLYQRAEKTADNSLAKTGIGYSLLKEGKYDEAEKVFSALTKAKDKESGLRGREGLAEVWLAEGKTEQALKETDSILAGSPKRVAANLIRARALHQMGQSNDAGAALVQATDIKAVSDFSWQRSDAEIARGNLARKKDPQAAVNAYKIAVKENPHSVEALSNLGAVLQDSGDAAQALQVLQKANVLDPTDKLLHGLLRQVQASIAQHQDLEKQKFIDESVKELLARQRDTKPVANADEWTTPPMMLSILGIQEEGPGSLSGRAGVNGVLENELYQALAARGIQVVERAVLDKLLSELKLGSSSLADPESQLKLGKILAARLMASGSLYESPTSTRVALRLIDTETSGLAMSSSEGLTANSDPAAVAAKLADGIARALHDKYPLKGRIASVDASGILLNLGKKHGLRAGQIFNVLGKSEPVELNGKILGYRETKLGQLEVTDVQEGFAQAKVVDKTGEWAPNQRVIQKD